MRRALISSVFYIVGMSLAATAAAVIQPRGPWEESPSPAPALSKSAASPAPAAAPAADRPKPAQLQVKPSPSPVPAASVPVSDKLILISIKDQTLKYFEGTKFLGEFKVSTGVKGTPTPAGEFTVLAKKPLVNYKGPGYSYPKTKWNLLFKRGSGLGYYIHGAYWHNDFGKPRSHGCVNVSYANMEPLYDWAEAGTRVSIE